MYGRPSRQGWTALAVAAGLAACGVTAALRQSEPGRAVVPVAQVAVAPLIGADGPALFDESDLAPGRVVRRCLVIGSSGASGRVRLAATDVTGDLAPYLRVTVAVGSGGDDDCTGFTGEVAYAGPLSRLSGGPAGAPGVPGGWSPNGTAESRTYQITVQVVDDNGAQGRTARAALRWMLVPAPTGSAPAPVPPSPTTTTPPPVTSGPVTSGPATSGPATSGPVTASPVTSGPVTASPVTSGPVTSGPVTSGPVTSGPASPAPVSSGPVSSGPVSSTTAGPPGDAAAGSSGPLRGLRRAWETVVVFAAQAGRHAAIPLFAILLVLLFLAVQDRIDRRDPKLREAPLSRHRYLTFGDRAPGEPTGTEAAQSRG